MMNQNCISASNGVFCTPVNSSTSNYLSANGDFFIALGASALLFMFAPNGYKILGVLPIGVYGFSALRAIGGIT